MAGLYIHVPFCHAKCWYCDFYSLPNGKMVNQWFGALLNEWQQRHKEIEEPLTTLYIGGGTPSMLPHDTLSRLIDSFRTQSMQEITIEVNPEDVSLEFVSLLVNKGVNRVSMGVQSLNDMELRAVGRRHTAQCAIEAAAMLHRAGITNLSLDLIFGLPGQTVESWKQSINGVLNLNPTHLSAYSLGYEPGTRLSAQLMAGKIKETPQEISAKMYDYLCNTMKKAGFEHYEISNFALPGKRSVHNSSYWQLTPYLGLGPSAHSYTRDSRKFNPSSLKKYIENNGVVWETEPENTNERLNDYIMVRLRTSEGIDMEETTKLFGPDAVIHIHNTATPHLASGLMERTPQGCLRIAEKAWIVSDGVMCDFMRV